MSGLGPHARRLLELGKDAGEPDEASLARSRAQLLRRIGRATAVVAAVTTVATTAKAAPLAAPVAAAPLAATPLAAAPLATAPLAAAPAASIATIPLVATPLVVKLAATLALVVGVGAATAAYQADPSRPVASVASPAQPASTAPPAAPRALAPVSPSVAPLAVPSAVEAVAVPIPPPNRVVASATESVEAPARVVAAAPPSTQPVSAPGVGKPIPSAPRGSAPAAAPSSLANDVASLREAQAALVAGDPRAALQAAERVQPGGPLSDEREGLRALAACALSLSDARDQAARFVERRPEAPLAARVRAACMAGK